VLHPRFVQWRNRLVGSSGFRRWVQKVPLVRQLARRRASDLFQLMTGFVHSQVVLACVELDLFNTVSVSPQSAQQLAERHQLEVARLTVLLEAAAGLGLLERSGNGLYGLGIVGVSLMAEPGLQALIRHHRALYRDLEDPLALLRGDQSSTHLGQFWAYASGAGLNNLETSAVRDYTAVMGKSQNMIAEQVLGSYSFTDCLDLLDVGGGNGSFLAAVARKYPLMQLHLFDLPAVLPLARAALTEAGLDARVSLQGGDFHLQELPANQDCVSLVRILHDHDDEPAGKLLGSVHRALKSDGVVLIAEPLKQEQGADALSGVYFGFYLMAMGSGRPRTFQEIRDMLQAAGFKNVVQHATPLPLVCSVITARA
jgi:demethylspheroidene O-methyltransferase